MIDHKNGYSIDPPNSYFFKSKSKQMEKTAIVKQVQGNGTFENEHGTFYSFEYVFDDDVALTANHKTQNAPHKPGDKVSYTIRGKNDYGNYGKVEKPKQNGYNSYGKASGSQSSFALSYAKDIAVAYITKGQDYTPEEIMATASKFNTWLKENK